MQAHIAAMVNADEKGWNAFKSSLGFKVEDILAKAAKGENITSLDELEAFKMMLV